MTFYCAVIIREICSRPVVQETCEHVVCAVSQKRLPVAIYHAAAFRSRNCDRSHACAFVSTCLKIDFAKRLDFLKRGQISAQETADLNYIRRPRNAAC